MIIKLKNWKPVTIDFVALIPVGVGVVVIVVVLFSVSHQLEGADALATQVHRPFAKSLLFLVLKANLRLNAHLKCTVWAE